MNRTLYTISGNGQQRSVLAGSFSQALTWAETLTPELAEADVITVHADRGVVDLIEPAQPSPTPAAERSTPRRPVPPPPVRGKRAERKERANEPPVMNSVGEITTAATAERLGINTKNVANLANKGWLTRGSFGHITLASIELCEQNFDSGTWKKPIEGVRKAKEEKPARAPKKAAAATKPARPAAPPAAKPAAARMVLIEKAAEELKLTEGQLLEIKKNGNIGGGNGWVNITQLVAYMQSPDYEPPFASH